MRILPLTLTLAACGLLSPSPGPLTRGTWPDGVPHDVVLVTLDTTRADHLGAYGYPRDTSPTFDALAERGLLFERLVVPMATTLPSHTSLMTGLWPMEHGILANVDHGGQRFVPSAVVLPLAGWLNGQGYATAAFVSAHPLARWTGIDAGFETFDQPHKAYERTADVTTDRAIAWLRDAPTDQPLLLWVHYFDPHNPYAPPPPYDRQFAGDDPTIDAWLAAREAEPSTRRPTGEEIALRPAVDGYDGEIRFMDAQLGRLLDAVHARRGQDRTVVVVAGDHGEGLNQHGEPGHGLVWQEQLHAPLVMVVPDQPPARVPQVLSMADVFPTLLGLVDLPGASAWRIGQSGVDVLADGAERPVLSQTSERQLMFGRPIEYALTSRTESCRVVLGGKTELYDLVADPHQLTTADDPQRAAQCRTLTLDALTSQRARGAELGAGRREALPAGDVEALKRLGYME